MNGEYVGVTTGHLGDEATDDDAQRMVELLIERGYDAEYLHQHGGGDCRAVPDDEWMELLDIIARENRREQT